MNNEIFSQVIEEFLDQTDLSVRQVAERACIPVGTLRSWLKGRADKQGPRRWQDIAQVANALHLTLAQVSRLLQSAHHESVAVLIKTITTESDRKLLDAWIEEIDSQSEPPDSLRRADYFFGREQEVNDLISSLMSMRPGSAISLCGPGGIGKTAIVAEALYRLYANGQLSTLFPNGVIVHDFYKQPDIRQAMETIIRWFGNDTRPSLEQATRRVLAGKKVLLVLEGAENTHELSHLLELTALSRILITSRRYQGLPQNEYVDIQPLDKKTSADLLQAWGKERAKNRQSAEQICDLVGHLPLAVELAGKYLAQRKQEATEYLVWLQQSPLAALDQGKRRLESVPVLMEKSLKQIPYGAHQALAVVGSMAMAPFGREVVAAALEQSVEKVGHWLGELVNWGLLIRPQKSYQVTHVLIHTYMRERLPSSDEALERLVDYYIRLAREERNNLNFNKETIDWRRIRRRINEDRQHMIDILHRALETARQVGNQQREIVLLTALGDFPSPLANQPIGYYEEALEIARAIGDRYSEAYVLREFGNMAYQWGGMESSIQFYEEALKITQEMGDWEHSRTLVNYLGEAYSNLGDVPSEIKYYEQALEMARRVGDRASEGQYLSQLGEAHRTLSHPQRALELYQQALSLLPEIGDSSDKAAILNNLAALYLDSGQPEAALELQKAALPLVREIGNRIGEAGVLKNMAVAYQSIGQSAQAFELLRRILPILKEVGDRKGESNTLNVLANVLVRLGKYEEAKTVFEQSTAFAQELGHPAGEASATLGLALLLYRYLQQPEEAIHHLEHAIVVLLNHGLSQDISGHRIETMRYYLDSMHRGEDLGGVDGREFTVKQVENLIDNTIYVMITAIDELSKWRETLKKVLIDTTRTGWFMETVFLKAVLSILDGKKPTLPDDNPYREALAAIQDGIVSGKSSRWLTLEQVELIIDNTTYVVTREVSRQAEWRKHIGNLREQAQEQGLQDETDFLIAVLAILDGQKPTLPVGHPYQDVNIG